MSENPKIKFPELPQLKLPRGTNAALDELAKRQHRTKSELARQAVLHALAVNHVGSGRSDPNAMPLAFGAAT
jgi:Ribbon-helix-helix protein, copG family